MEADACAYSAQAMLKEGSYVLSCRLFLSECNNPKTEAKSSPSGLSGNNQRKTATLMEPPLVVFAGSASLTPDAVTISIKVGPVSRITSSYRRRSGRPSRRAVCERPAARRCRAETLAARRR